MYIWLVKILEYTVVKSLNAIYTYGIAFISTYKFFYVCVYVFYKNGIIPCMVGIIMALQVCPHPNARSL